MKKTIVSVSSLIIILLLLSACSVKLDTTIDLAGLKSDNGTFSYKDLHLQETFREVSKIIDYTTKPTFGFRDGKLTAILFLFRPKNFSDDLEEFYIKCTKKLTEIYPERPEISENISEERDPNSGELIGNAHTRIYQWHANSENLKTNLFVQKVTINKTFLGV